MKSSRETPHSAGPDILLDDRNIKNDTEEADSLNDEPRNTLAPNDYEFKSKSTFIAEDLRRLSISPAPSGRLSPIPYAPYHQAGVEESHSEPSTLNKFWTSNKPSILVALSQLFGALMNLSARLLELDGDGMHPIQVLLLRQGMTVIGCCSYMWWKSIPEFPMGQKGVRWLLLFRGFSGFFGIYGMWYSMMYLPLADATVITFLAPGIAGLICYFTLREPFTRAEQIATAVALLGVVLIAKPTAFFTKSAPPSESMTEAPEQPASGIPGLEHETTAEERLLAVGVALLGVLGAAGAFTSIRTIGKRAHPLISVNYFGVVCTVICIVILSVAPALNISQPHLRWITPASLKGWCLLISLGFLGFIMQYLLTAGLSADKSNRANAMVYTHMLFAVSFDRWIFGHSMSFMSFTGCALILGSAITIVFAKAPPAPKNDDIERQGNITSEAEDAPMLIGVGGNADGINLQRSQ